MTLKVSAKSGYFSLTCITWGGKRACSIGSESLITHLDFHLTGLILATCTSALPSGRGTRRENGLFQGVPACEEVFLSLISFPLLLQRRWWLVSV